MSNNTHQEGKGMSQIFVGVLMLIMFGMYKCTCTQDSPPKEPRVEQWGGRCKAAKKVAGNEFKRKHYNIHKEMLKIHYSCIYNEEKKYYEITIEVVFLNGFGARTVQKYDSVIWLDKYGEKSDVIWPPTLKIE